MSRGRPAVYFGISLIAGLCLVSGLLAHYLLDADLAPAIFWPPAGIALAGFMAWGAATLPAAFLGTAGAALAWGLPAGQAWLLGLAVTLQAGIGGGLLRGARVSNPLDGVGGFLWLLLLGGLVAGLAGAIPAYYALRLVDAFWEMPPLRGYVALAAANLISVLILVPFLLPRPSDAPPSLGGRLEIWGVLAVLACTTLLLAHPTLVGMPPALFRPYPVMPFLLWLALRSTPRHTALGLVLFQGVAATAPDWGRGNLFSLVPDTLLLPIHGFIFMLGLSFLVLAVLMEGRSRAERALRTSEARLRNVIGLIRNCLWETDARGRFVYLDSHVESVFTLPATEMLGRTPEEIWPEGLGPAMAKLFRRTRYKDEAEWAAHSYRQLNGETAYLETNCAALRDGDGRHQGWQGITREVSERFRMARDLDETNRRFRQLAENIQEVFWVSASLQRFLYVSPQCEEVLGQPPALFYADYKSWNRLVLEEDRPVVAEAWQRVGRREAVEVEFRIRHPRKGVRWLRARSIPFEERAGEPLNAGILEDITDRRRDTQARLDQAVAQRDALVREVHHRIKNNLQTVVGLLRREASKHPEARDAIAAAIAQVNSVAVVHGLHGRLTRPSIFLCDLLAAIVHSVSELSGVVVQFRGLREGCGDLVIQDSETVAFALILNELVTNAVKHARPGSEPAAPLVAMSVVSRTARIDVVNPGGLPADFDFAAGVGLGTGLGLVRTLMPERGLTLAFRQDEGRVIVEMGVEVPVLTPGSANQREWGKDGHAQDSDRR